MAWKEWSELSKADKEHEDRRQASIVAQSCLERAVATLQHVPLKEDVVNQVQDIAAIYFNFVYAQADIAVGFNVPDKVEDKPKVDLDSFPKPTPEQKQVIDAIVKQTRLREDIAYGKIIEWYKGVAGKVGYPKEVDSVDIFIEWLGN